MGPLPETINGNKYVVVFVEYLTRWPEAFAIAKADAPTIAMLIKDHIVPRFGAPEILLSDRGSIFISELITTVCASLQIVQVNSTAYHPQANGLVERMNGTIGRLLRRVLASHKNHQRWDELLPLILYSIRITPNSTTGYTPFELLYGRLPSLPIDRMLLPDGTTEDLGNMRKWMEHLQQLRDLTLDNYRVLAEDRHKALADTRWYHPTVGTNVWVYQALQVTKSSKSVSRKLHNPWTGPWTVAAIDEEWNNVEVYDAARPNKRRLLHLSMVKPYKGAHSQPSALTLPEDLRAYQLDGEDLINSLPLKNGTETVPQHPEPISGTVNDLAVPSVDVHLDNSPTASKEANPIPSVDLVQQPRYFEVEDIVGHNMQRGRYFYRVRYRGYGPEYDEFRPAGALRLAPEILSRYQLAHDIPRNSRSRKLL